MLVAMQKWHTITTAAVGNTDSLHPRKYKCKKPQKLVPTPKAPREKRSINNNALSCSMGSTEPKRFLK